MSLHAGSRMKPFATFPQFLSSTTSGHTVRSRQHQEQTKSLLQTAASTLTCNKLTMLFFASICEDVHILPRPKSCGQRLLSATTHQTCSWCVPCSAQQLHDRDLRQSLSFEPCLMYLKRFWFCGHLRFDLMEGNLDHAINIQQSPLAITSRPHFTPAMTVAQPVQILHPASRVFTAYTMARSSAARTV
eukprot:14119-Amphidinium_carterae.1